MLTGACHFAWRSTCVRWSSEVSLVGNTHSRNTRNPAIPQSRTLTVTAAFLFCMFVSLTLRYVLQSGGPVLLYGLRLHHESHPAQATRGPSQEENREIWFHPGAAGGGTADRQDPLPGVGGPTAKGKPAGAHHATGAPGSQSRVLLCVCLCLHHPHPPPPRRSSSASRGPTAGSPRTTAARTSPSGVRAYIPVSLLLILLYAGLQLFIKQRRVQFVEAHHRTAEGVQQLMQQYG